MSVGMIGTKLGMTQVFDEAGNTVPVTVIEAEPNVVVQRKTVTPDGYEAIQVGYGDRRRSRTNGPLTGHFGKAGVQPKRVLREFHTSPGEEFEAGQQITLASIFSAGQMVQVIGTSKGKGFAGGIKRHGFSGGNATHGSKVHRAPQSSGATAANRVFPGTRKPGHLGHARCTVKGLRVVQVDAERNLLLLRGAVPGPNGGTVIVTPA